jgi:hypothetical protein
MNLERSLSPSPRGSRRPRRRGAVLGGIQATRSTGRRSRCSPCRGRRIERIGDRPQFDRPRHHRRAGEEHPPALRSPGTTRLRRRQPRAALLLGRVLLAAQHEQRAAGLRALQRVALVADQIVPGPLLDLVVEAIEDVVVDDDDVGVGPDILLDLADRLDLDAAVPRACRSCRPRPGPARCSRGVGDPERQVGGHPLVDLAAPVDPSGRRGRRTGRCGSILVRVQDADRLDRLTQAGLIGDQRVLAHQRVFDAGALVGEEGEPRRRGRDIVGVRRQESSWLIRATSSWCSMCAMARLVQVTPSTLVAIA